MVNQERIKPKPRAAAYIRVSSKDQTEGYSLESQELLIRERCQRDGYKLVGIYAEEGISGATITKRDAFQKMYADGMAGLFDVLIVWHADRFTRDVQTGVAAFYGLKNSGIKIVGLQDGFNSANDDIMSLLSIGMAAKYRKDLIANIMRGQRQKLASGDPRIGPAGRPIGRYWDEQAGMFKLKRTGNALDEEVREWRLVAQQYLDGVPVREICEQIIKRGSGKLPHTLSNIRKHLRAGLGDTHTITHNGQSYTFPAEPIVDKATQEAIVKLMGKRKATPHREPKKFLLSGVIHCAKCGKKLHTMQKGRDGSCYYMHSKADRNGCDGLKTIRGEHIEAAVLKESFLFFGVDVKAYEAAIAEFLPDADTRKQAENDVKTLKQQIAKHEKEKDAIVHRLLNTDRLSNSIIDAANLKVETIDRRLDFLRDELHEKERRLDSMLTPEEYRVRAKRAREEWRRVFTGFDTMEQMPWQNRKHLIDLMFDGTDDRGRAFGVYIQNVRAQVFDYEIYGRFTEGARFLKAFDSDYYGPETKPIEEQWKRDFEAMRTEQGKSKSIGLGMGDVGFEPTTG
jgi:site-specific DNA recombinase